MLDNDVGVGSKNPQDDVCPMIQNDNENNRTNITFIYEIWNWGSYRQPKMSLIGPIFCALCLVEAVLRSRDARQMALHNRALGELEQQMVGFARRGSLQISRIFGEDLSDDSKQKNRLSFIDRWMKFNRSCWTWSTAVATFAFWVLILPTESNDFRQYCGSSDLHDSAIMTQWLYVVSETITMFSLAFNEYVNSIIWTKIIPYRIHKQPQRFIKRIKVVLQVIRFARFAGPLLRMVRVFIYIALHFCTIMFLLVSFDMLHTGTETAGSIEDNVEDTLPI